MAAVTGWVRQIVIVVVLGGIAELMLPRGTTRGYVRVVVGLLVMLTILDPVLRAVGNRVVWAELETWPDQVRYPGSYAQVDQAQLQQETLRLTVETYRERLSEEIASLVDRVDGIETVGVAVDIESRPGNVNYGEILALAIAVRERPGETAGVVPVKPVQLGQGVGNETTRPEWPPELEESRRQIYELLRLNFGVSSDLVDLSLVPKGE